jgi:hypothetical protein
MEVNAERSASDSYPDFNKLTRWFSLAFIPTLTEKMLESGGVNNTNISSSRASNLFGKT